MLPSDWGSGYPNIWLGFTAEDQKHYDQRWRILASIDCAVRFVSYEPAIGPLRLGDGDTQPDWLIVGGESGHGARLMNPQWARDIVSDCMLRGVAPFFKQWGSYQNHPDVFEKGHSVDVVREEDPFGKGGGMLDGEIIRQFPIARYQAAEAA
jgi:protein gp37